MDRGYEYIFFQRHTDGQEAREMMLMITNHQGNASQNHHITPPVQMAIIKKKKKKQVLVRIGREGDPHALLMGM